jgi:aminopeptidase N
MIFQSKLGKIREKVNADFNSAAATDVLKKVQAEASAELETAINKKKEEVTERLTAEASTAEASPAEASPDLAEKIKEAVAKIGTDGTDETIKALQDKVAETTASVAAAAVKTSDSPTAKLNANVLKELQDAVDLAITVPLKLDMETDDYKALNLTYAVEPRLTTAINLNSTVDDLMVVLGKMHDDKGFITSN